MTLAQIIEAATKKQLENYSSEALKRVAANLRAQQDRVADGAAEWAEDVIASR